MASATAPNSEFLNCPHCSGPFTNPRCLPCLDVFCFDCLRRLAGRNQSFICPKCQSDTKVPRGGVDKFLVAWHIKTYQELVEVSVSNRPNVSCYKGQTQTWHARATVKCLDCNEYYCSECNRGHHMIKTIENHERISLSKLKEQHFETAVQKQVTFCQQHPNSIVEIFCKGCQIPICQRCHTTKHELHQCDDLKTYAENCKRENKTMLREDFSNAEQFLGKRKQKVNNAIEKIKVQFEQNKRTIHDRYLRMRRKIKLEERDLINKEETSKDQKIADYQMQLEKIEQKTAFLRDTKAVLEKMTSFSPNWIIAKQSNEMKSRAKKALEKTGLPELFLYDTMVTSTGEPVIDFNVDTMVQKTIECFEGPVEGIAILEELVVAWQQSTSERPTDFFVSGKDSEKSQKLKERLEKKCPRAFRMVPMKEDGNEVLVVTEHTQAHHIKIVYVNQDKDETIDLKGKHSPYAPYAVAVDQQGDIFFTDAEKRQTVRKWTKSVVQTIRKKKDGARVFEDPCHISVNVNGNVIVSDRGNNALTILDSIGTLRKTYAFPTGNANRSTGVCTDDEGNIYVTDYEGHCILKHDKNGTFLEKCFGSDLENPTTLEYSNGRFIVGQANGEVKDFQYE